LAEYTDPNIQKRIHIIEGDITKYLENKEVGLKRPSRIEDVGIGTGTREVVLETALPMLSRQVSRTRKHMKKAHITDAATRKFSDQLVVKWLNSYLSLIDGEIVTINGYVPTDVETPFSYGTCVKTYIDKLCHDNTVHVYRHDVRIITYGKWQAKLFIYTCMNGSRMMQTMLVYK